MKASMAQIRRRIKRHAPWLAAATVAALATVPAGNALKDYGLIHTFGLTLCLAVAGDLFWIVFGE